MENDKIIRELIADAQDHLVSAQMCTLDGKEEELKSNLGQAESLIEKTFDILNGIKAPPKVIPEELMTQTPFKASENGSIRLPECQDDTASVLAKEVNDGPLKEKMESIKIPDDFGEVKEEDVDRAIGDSLQSFFSCIAMSAVKGEIVRYKENKLEDESKWTQISFVVNMPQTKKFVYSNFLLKEFDRWLDEYGYLVKGTFRMTANRNVYFEVMIADKCYSDEQKTIEEEDKEWSRMQNDAETRINRNGECYKYQAEYENNIQIEKTIYRNPEDFADICKDYNPSVEKKLCDGANGYATWLTGKSSELSAVVDAAAISILNANRRGDDHKPSKSKLSRIKPELIAALRVLADRAIIYGLKALAFAILKKLNLAEAILALIRQGDFTIRDAQKKAFAEGI